MPPKSKKIADREPNYETAYAELQEIVTKLEAGDLPLEEALSLYERGQALAKLCAGLLDKSELRIQELGAASGDAPPDES
jgi:exodeoxyribonuclease VII small subunit